jgi:hypothetical protein
VHGFKKPKNQWSKKSNKNKFDDEFCDSNKNSKKNKKTKSYYRTQNDEYDEYNDYK